MYSTFLAEWPSERPRLDFDDHGWFHPLAASELKRFAIEKKMVVVEIGSWLGLSTRFILDNFIDCTLFAIDTWEGSEEHFRQDVEVAGKIPNLYEQFVYNCWEYRARLHLVKHRSTIGLARLHAIGVKPDLIFLDASHDYLDVLADLTTISDLFPGAVIIGDDWNWGDQRPVQRAVMDFCSARGIHSYNNGRTYTIPPQAAMDMNVRKHFHIRPAGSGCKAWEISQVLSDSKHLPTEIVDLCSIGELRENVWFVFDGHVPTVMNIIDHMDRIESADLSYPIVIDNDGRLIDGMHRVCKAIRMGRERILCKRLPENYQPHFYVATPKDLPWGK